MAQSIVENKKYLRIKKLNSDKKQDRRSLQEDQLLALQESEHYGDLQETVVISTKDHMLITTAATEADVQSLVTPGEHDLKGFTATVEQKKHMRFSKDSGEMQSGLRDINLGHRGTIMDVFVNDPLKIHFSGPSYSEKVKKVKATAVPIADDQTVIIQAYANRFTGFYVLFWLSVSFLLAKVVVEYYFKHDGDLLQSEIVQYMTTDLFRVACVDLCMYLSTYFVHLVQWLCKIDFIRWEGVGWLVTSIYEVLFIVTFTYLAEHIMKFKWISKIFLFLHSCVLLMKMHSYAFYNGYLWQIQNELSFSQRSLAILKDADEEVDEAILKTLEQSVSFCKFELCSQSTDTPFPTNINFKNYFMYTMFPILIYQIEYPRTTRIRWGYVFEKVAAIFGIIFIMMVTAQLLIYPVAIRAIASKELGMSFKERAMQWPQLLIDMVPGFIVMYLLVWYLIWDAILNCIAELTKFGDRYFYGDWWNCVDWIDFSRLWNVPVHSFLLRHVYHSSLSAFRLSKTQATLMTFILSSLVHELAMYVIFGKLRFYLFLFQMLQLPLIAFNNMRFLRHRKVLLNAMFWLGICTGPSVICTIYLTF